MALRDSQAFPVWEDKDLALAFQAGDERAYRAIHDRFEDRVLRVCRRILGNKDDAQDATQETFIRVYQALPRFNGRYQMGAWVTRIATNVCLDQIRSRARKPTDPIPLEILELQEATGRIDDPEDASMRLHESRRVRRVLASLPPMHRAAIVLRDFEGFSYGEIAIALQISECQVKALIHRARQRFKKSWIGSTMTALLPWRILSRAKDLDGSAGREHVAQAVSNAAQAASSCSTLLQQCGQIVSERVAGAVAVAVVGAAAIAGHAPAQEAPLKVTQVSGSEISADRGRDLAISASVKEPKQRASTEDLEPHENVAAPAPGPSASPEPSPTSEEPSASPSPSPTTPQPGPPKEATVPAPPPPRVAAAFGRAVPAPYETPPTNDTRISCDGSSFNQRMHVPLWDVSGPLESDIVMTVGQTASLDVTLVKDGRTIHYVGGASSVMSSVKDGVMRMSFSGSYGWSGADDPEKVQLPTYGRFSAEVTLDCAAFSVVTETLTLTND